MVFAAKSAILPPFKANRPGTSTQALVELDANCENAIYGKTHFRDGWRCKFFG